MSVSRIDTRLVLGVALLSAVITSSVWAQSQGELNDEAYAKFQKADAKLNATYKEIFRLYDDDPVFLKCLRNAQRKWIEFRDAHVQSHFPPTDTPGSMRPQIISMMLQDMTEVRTKQLREWLDGDKALTGYSDSIKTKEDLDKARKVRVPPTSPAPVKKGSEDLSTDVPPSLCSLNSKSTPIPLPKGH